MKRIISVAGARPNFMKVAPINRAFKRYSQDFEHLIVHTGQHYDFSMSDAFFRDLELSEPAEHLGVGSASHAEQTANIMSKFEKVCLKYQPDMVIVVGDVNSTIACTLTAVKMGIKTAHIEGGLRSFDRYMPEEINRMATDAICDYCFVTEESAVKNLIQSGFTKESIYFVGNTMIDSLKFALPIATKSKILSKLNLSKKEFALVTLHRPTNVDNPEKLKEFIEIFDYLANFRKIVFPVHPRTQKNLINSGLYDEFNRIGNLITTEPLGYIDFLALMLNSDFVLTDSGGIQEETTFAGIQCITVRTTTERPVTIDIGTNILIQPEKSAILSALNDIINGNRKTGSIPPLWDGMAGERIVDIIVNRILK